MRWTFFSRRRQHWKECFRWRGRSQQAYLPSHDACRELNLSGSREEADRYYSNLWRIERGAGGLTLPGSDEPVIGNPKTGLIYSVEPGTRLTASDLQSRLYLRLPTAFLCRKLEAVLDGQQVDSIAFQPMFDQMRGAGATIRRLSDFLFAELEHSDTPLTNQIAIRSFEENLALCLLLGLPHNYTERLQRQKAAAAPGNVRRAEAFMQANASHPDAGIAAGPAGTGASGDTASRPNAIAGPDLCRARLQQSNPLRPVLPAQIRRLSIGAVTGEARHSCRVARGWVPAAVSLGEKGLARTHWALTQKINAFFVCPIRSS